MKKKKTLSLFFLALFISLLIWVGIKLTRLQTATLEIDISVTNTPTGIIPTSIEPESFRLVVEGTGLDLLKLYFNKLSYYIDLKNTHYGKNYIPLRLENLTFIKTYHLEILQQPDFDNILVVMDNMTSKSLKVRPIFSDKESKDFFDENLLALQPDEVTLKGPKKFLSNMYEITTQPFNRKKHEQGSKIELDLPENDLVSIDTRQVEIVKLKSKIARKTFMNVPISHPDTVKIFPEFATIKVSGEKGTLDTVSSKDISVFVEMEDQEKNNLPVKVRLLPGVELEDQIPERVNIEE
ncbi:MAG: hypothetical protein KGY75_00960 [Candidatus Cloacimonetes bacterium]|nr:hypothetical protein [Candidatus Cloacimonadota bacterium]MBS3766686.1 hypothetical protein [Candidatus Cloacimonadota bacterium]